VDGGFHALGVALPQADEAAAEPAAAPDAEPVPEVVA
jgi:hypothetical protein